MSSAWLVAKDISKLQTHEIESYINEPYKKSGDLLAGYRIALSPKKWEEERANNAVYTNDVEEDAAEVDELDSDETSNKKSKSKKRKRESDGAPTKTRKPAKLKKDSTEPLKKGAPSKGRKSGLKSKAMVESEDEAEAEGEDEDDAGPSKKASPPPTKKVKREKPDDDGEDCKFTLQFNSLSFITPFSAP